ncbi:MAG TPA: hypothetical protein VGB22_08745 [candidate division Zixibacteria bacterium]|jgi:hypothetical protein
MNRDTFIHRRRSHRRIKAVTLIALACAFGVCDSAHNSALAAVKTKPSADIQRRDTKRVLVGGDYLARDASLNKSVVDDRPTAATSAGLQSDALPPLPGAHIANTSYDSQANDSQGHQIARNPGEDFVHMVWTHWDEIPQDVGDRDRFVNYASWDVLGSPGFELYPGFDGVSIGLGDFARAGFGRLDIDSDNLAHTVFHQYPDPGIENYSAWHVFLPIEGGDVLLPEKLPDSLLSPDITEVLWPDIAITQNNGLPKDNTSDIFHVIAMPICPCGQFGSPSGDLVYWRWDQANPGWPDPIIIDSSNGALSYVIDAADGTDKVAVAFTQNYEAQWNNLFNLVYRESSSGGLGWFNGTELGNNNREYVTNYTDNTTPGPQVWGHISIAYDHDAVLHIVWDEQRLSNISDDIAIRHWDDNRQTIDQVALGYYENDANYAGHLNLNKITLGIGDGSAFCSNVGLTNENFLYVTYTKNCGETSEERADTSTQGICNGELYITGSYNSGASWSKPVNLTNTKTPNCRSANPDSLCASDVMATIARDISGQEGIDILYLVDREAATWADGSGWTMNQVIYLNLPGGDDAPHVCPHFAPAIAALLPEEPLCEYHAPPGAFTEVVLSIDNVGNALLNGSIMVTQGASWLSVTPSGPFEIADIDPAEAFTLTLDAGALTEGLYVGEVQIVHDDDSVASPIILPINFFVVDEFYCPEELLLGSAKASPGVLSLQVASTGRFGAPDVQGGLFRFPGGSSSIGDASLLIAHGSQSPDTVVYHRFGGNMSDPGQLGFRPLADLEVDTSAYGTGQGYASARVEMTTRDSLLKIELKWCAPQHPDSADFIAADIRITNRSDEPGSLLQTLDQIVAALWIDFDILDGGAVGSQRGADNQGEYWGDSNLIYQYGFDTAGHAGSFFQSTQRFSGGVTYIAGRDAAGTPFFFEAAPLHGGIRANTENQTGGGPSSGLMYSRIVGTPGITFALIDPGSSQDRYTYLTLDQNLTLSPGASSRYVIALVSDTLQHFAYSPAPGEPDDAGLHAAVQKAWAWAYSNLGCNCPNLGDPVLDGLVNIFDVVKSVDVAFRAALPPQSPVCPYEDTDVTCDGMTNVFDVVAFVDVAFRSADPEVVFCDACG